MTCITFYVETEKLSLLQTIVKQSGGKVWFDAHVKFYPNFSRQMVCLHSEGIECCNLRDEFDRQNMQIVELTRKIAFHRKIVKRCDEILIAIGKRTEMLFTKAK